MIDFKFKIGDIVYFDWHPGFDYVIIDRYTEKLSGGICKLYLVEYIKNPNTPITATEHELVLLEEYNIVCWLQEGF